MSNKLSMKLTALLTFLAIITIGDLQFIANFQFTLPDKMVLAQTPDAQKSQADTLVQQGIQQFRNNQYEPALQSFRQAVNIYQQIKDIPGQIKALQALSYAYESRRDFPNAILSYSEALKIAQEIKDRRLEALILGSLGNVYFAQRDFSKASNYLEQSLTIAREIKEPQIEILTLGNLGNIYYAMLDYPKAIEYFDQLLTLARSIPDPKSEIKALSNIGISYYYLGNYPKAIEYEQQWLKIEQNLKNRQGEAAALANLGLAYLAMGDYPRAIEYNEQTVAIAREIKDRKSEGKALGNIGLVYTSLAEFEKAIDYAQQWLTIAKETKDRESEGKALGNIGLTYYSLGDLPKAIEYQEQWLSIAKEIKDRQSEIKAVANLGNVYLYLGEYPKAIEYYQQNLAIAKEIKDRQGEGQTLQNLSLAYIALKDYPQAIKYIEQSLAISREIKDRNNEGRALGSLGLAYFSLRDYPKALDNLQKWLAIAREIQDRQSEGKALGSLGIVYGELKDYTKAIEYFQQHLAIAREIKDKHSEAIALRNLGNALFRSNNLPESEKTLLKSIDVLESLRTGLKDRDQVSIFDTQADTYSLLQEVLIGQNKTEAALEISERGRARSFVELLAKRLASRTQNTSTALASPTISQIKQIAKSQNTTLVQYSIIKGEFEVEGKPKIQPSELYIWVIKPTGEVTFRRSDLKPIWQQKKTSLEDLIAQTREFVGAGSRGLAAVARVGTDQGRNQLLELQQVYQILIEPIADLLPTDPQARVTFIPQGELFLVPFVALQDAQRKYLIQKHTILTAPSIQVLDLTQKQRQLADGKDILVVGNPNMPSVPQKVGQAPEKLPRLPGAEREAQAIAQLLNTQALIGNNATKMAILPLLPKARIIHLATHGLLDDYTGTGIPGAIALAPSGNDNGLLTASEILDLKLRAELVVLSACDTGRGKLTGDGVIGLSRSLISAGAPSVIVSLWAVPDAPTATLMSEFYQNLQKTPDKALALRQAMLTTMKNNPNPRDWAAFTLIGEAQ